jgi:tetratricopeptide (TPR) repeat protein
VAFLSYDDLVENGVAALKPLLESLRLRAIINKDDLDALTAISELDPEQRHSATSAAALAESTQVSALVKQLYFRLADRRGRISKAALGSFVSRWCEAWRVICPGEVPLLWPNEMADLYWTLSHTQHALKQSGNALEAAQKAAALAPNNVNFATHLAALLLISDRLDEAEAVLQHALAIDPNSARAHQHMSTTLMKRKNWMAAIEAANRAVALRPEEAEFKAHLASIVEAAEKERVPL